MKKCPYCGKEYSHKVFVEHIKICPKRPSEEELKKAAEAEFKRLKDLQDKTAAKNLKDLPEFKKVIEERDELIGANEKLIEEIESLKGKIDGFQKATDKFNKVCLQTLEKVEKAKDVKRLDQIEQDFSLEIKSFFDNYGVTPVRAGEVIDAIKIKKSELGE